MTVTAADDRARGLVLLAGLPAAVAGAGLCWLLATPEDVALPTSVALVFAVTLLGLGMVPHLGVTPSPTVIGGVGAAWCVTLLVTAWFRVALQAGVSPFAVGASTFVDAVRGSPDLIALGASVLVVAWTVSRMVGDVEVPEQAVAALAAMGVLSLALAGHASTRAWGTILVGAHVLAAGWWCGTLAALVITVRGRAAWSRALPAFSRYAGWAVAVVAVSGVAAGLLELGGLPAVVESGYGRILLLKLVGLLVLAGFGVWHRRVWLPRARRQRADERAALRYAVGELLVMAVVLGLAAGLATTPP